MNRFLDAVNTFIFEGIKNHRILLRGSLAEETQKFLKDEISEHSGIDLEIEIKPRFADWKLNTLEILLKTEFTYFALAQEDHLVVCERGDLRNYFLDCIKKDVKIARITSFLRGQNFVSSLAQAYSFKTSKNAILFELPKKIDPKVNKRNYLVSLLGFYERRTLIELLRSVRPILKNFPPFTPFDFEQSIQKTWYLPAVCAFSQRELLACIDDDQGGISLQNRGKYPLDFIRHVDHDKESTGGSMTKLINKWETKLIYGDFRLFGYIKVHLSRDFRNKLASSLLISKKVIYSTIWWRYVISKRLLVLDRGECKLRLPNIEQR